MDSRLDVIKIATSQKKIDRIYAHVDPNVYNTLSHINRFVFLPIALDVGKIYLIDVLLF